jgi:hypothetical protein
MEVERVCSDLYIGLNINLEVHLIDAIREQSKPYSTLLRAGSFLFSDSVISPLRLKKL